MGRRFALVFVSLLILAGCSGMGSSDKTPSNCTGDTAYLLNSKCQKLHWDSLPITLTFSDNIPQNVRVNTIKAAAEWENAAGKTLFAFDELGGRSAEHLNMITITAENQWEGAANENAKTFYLYEEQFLRQTIISIRDRVIQTAGIDTFSVILHELGHVLGLGHEETDRNSIRYPQLGMYESARTLAPVDIERLKTLY